MGNRLTIHFQGRMVERGIDIDHVKRAIKSPDFTKPAYEGTILARKKVDEARDIEVIYRKSGFKNVNEYVIVTAYYQPRK